jgi:hypothetical protein
VSGDGGAVPAPLILDVSVLIAVARGDARVMELIQGYDADGQPLIISALAITGALHDISGRDAEAMLRGLEMLDNTARGGRSILFCLRTRRFRTLAEG